MSSCASETWAEVGWGKEGARATAFSVERALWTRSGRTLVAVRHLARGLAGSVQAHSAGCTRASTGDLQKRH